MVDEVSDEEKDNLLAKRESSHEYDWSQTPNVHVITLALIEGMF
jgi:hypothetical protein